MARTWLAWGTAPMEIGNVEISDFFVPLFSWRTIIEHVISDNVVPEGGNIEMQLLVHITNHEECVTPIMEKMMEAGIHGASIVDCEGMLASINQDSVNAPSIFGGLRRFVNPERPQNKMILVVLKDEEVKGAIDIIHEVSGDLKLPNTGILFTVPVTRWEGVCESK